VGPPLIDGGSCHDCAICTKLPSPFEEFLHYRRRICFDANLKANSYKNTASASSNIKPVLRTYFGSVQEKVSNLASKGQLNLKHTLGSGADLGEDLDYCQPCTSSLSCSRQDTTNAGSTVCDIKGIVGGCCSHGVPLRNGFCDMSTHEQFSYYLHSSSGSCTGCLPRYRCVHRLRLPIQSHFLQVCGHFR